MRTALTIASGGQDDDAALARAAQGGDAEAFCTLLARHHPMLVALCLRALGDPALAEDAAQEAAIQALLGLDGLRQPERFGPWLSGIGLNVCRMWQRTRGRESTSWEALPEGGKVYPFPSAAGTGNPEEQAAATDLTARVRQAVDDLPDGQRSVVRLFYLSDLSYAETAAALGIGIGAVRTRLHKAHGTLRRRLYVIWREETMATEGKPKTYTCSFCGKSNDEVHRMIAGPPEHGGSAICDECVDLCNRVIAEARANGRTERATQATTTK